MFARKNGAAAADSRPQGRSRSSAVPSTGRRSLAAIGVLALGSTLFSTVPAYAASVSSASFAGGTGTTVKNGILFAKSGSALKLNVVTDNTTRCVEVTGAHEGTQTLANAGTTNWSFDFTANTGNGVQTVTLTSYANVNPQGKCVADKGENLGTNTASYTLDNDITGPVVTSALAPAPNAAGWNKSDVTITWSATDDSGVKSIVPASDTVTANTAVDGVEKRTTATDNVGNTTTGTVTVKLDKTAPTVTSSRTPAANNHGWNNTDVAASFTTTDALSGVDTHAAGKTFGEGANQSHTGTGTDVAGNSASATVSGINVDTTAPTLSGAPTAQPNGTNGWYTSDVTVAWTASDALSQLDGAAPANGTISGEGEGLKATETVTDKAGNSTTASSPAVKIDKTKPTTTATAPAGWNKADTTVTLSASDGGSGVATTHYQVGTGAVQTGTSVAFATDGEHSLKYWSVDNAGNTEPAKTVTVKVDKTAPSISASQSPAAVNGWNNRDVTVSFACGDTGSGIASCTPDQVISEDGKAQAVTGTAMDTAGNTAGATHVVNLDKTVPTISAAADRRANELGWYNDDVVVSFTASDSLSGIHTVTASKTLAQGEGQSASGTATDVAGNSANAGVTGINVDKTNPVLTGAASATGWSRGDVTVTWTASDALSGLNGAVPAPSVVEGEGDDLSAGASVTDKAGNTTAATVDGIKIDRTAPNTSAMAPAALANGWHGPSTEVTLTGTDNLSGVARTFYRVGTGATQEYTGPFTHAVEGASTITYWSTDVAGNTEGEKTLELKLDGTAPATAIDLPAAFENGWYADSVPVAFKATDAESGVATTFYKVGDGAAQQWDGTFDHVLSGTSTITYWSVDAVGNVEASKSHEIKVDTSVPTIVGSRTPAANDLGWNNTDVTASFVCEDSQSGVAIANCTPATPVVNEGAGQEVVGVAKDNVGKTATTTVGDINIDKTAPTLTGALQTTGRTASGWYKADVKVAWTGGDTLSGIDPATQPADSTITGQGDNLGATASIKDNAGNTGNGSVTGVKIDTTKPVVSGATVNDDGTARTANAAGWFNSAVRVRYSATDNLSGVQEKSADTVLLEDGAGQTATGSASDNADNTASTTVTGINIDSQKPQTSANNVCEGSNGWCKSQATVTLTAADQPGLSGVKEIHYSVNDGPMKVAAGASTEVNVPLQARSGLAKVEFFAVDNAGNAEALSGVALKFDSIAPIVTHTINPTANSAGWNNANTTVHFDAKDDDGGSGVDTATVTPDVTVSTETAATGLVVNGSAKDLAGNTGTDSLTVRLDKTAPGITAAVKSGTKGANGFYTGPVTVGFTCTDALSTIATCPTDVVLNSDGLDQKATGEAVDKAGNKASVTLSGINIDSVKPVITMSTVKASYTVGEAIGFTCTATDATSGVDANGCKVTTSGGTANGVGTFTYTATATDMAGNVQTSTGTYKVLYAWNGFLQPINDTAHQVDQGVSVFKGGSTIPAKFQVKNAAGQVVQAGSATWTTPSAGAATAATVTEDAYALTATTGGLYKYDATAQQYIYNWSTKGLKVGQYYRIGVTLDDGQTYSVNIGLR